MTSDREVITLLGREALRSGFFKVEGFYWCDGDKLQRPIPEEVANDPAAITKIIVEAERNFTHLMDYLLAWIRAFYVARDAGLLKAGD